MNGARTEPYLFSVGMRRDKPIDWERYPFSLPAIRHLDSIELHPAVTFFVGENGCGKSTLLEAIAVAWGFNREGGSRNFRFQTRSEHSSLNEYLRLSRGTHRARDGFFLRAESFFNVATEIDRLDVVGSYGGRSLHEQSHGESFLALVMSRFNGQSFFILDEPEAALSPSRQLAMLVRINQLVEDRSQFIIATHSPILMAYPNASIYEFSEDGLRRAAYEDTEHYLVTKRFLNDSKRQLDILFGD